MDILYTFQNSLLTFISNEYRRYLHDDLPWNSRFVAIKGLRGVGKTTMLLQHLKYELKDLDKHLYATLDHPYFYEHNLYDLARSFHQQGGQTLLLDEVHKYPNWSKEIKLIFDGLPKLQVVFSASSALDILRGEADLSRRVLTYELHGLSFREYLHFQHGHIFETWDISHLTENHVSLATEISTKIQPLRYFKQYLKGGYFPFAKDELPELFKKRIHQILEITLAEDMNYINDYSQEDIFKLKKLIAVISNVSPFTINISEIAAKLKIGRNTVKEFLHALEKAGIVNFLNRAGKSSSVLQKPDKIFIENTNFSYALSSAPNVGTLRETFVVNQLKNADYQIVLPKVGDIEINITDEDNIILEVGGKSKTIKQISQVKRGHVVADDLEIGFKNKIPIWMLGFLY